MRVLVADDHSIIRMALKHILTDLRPDIETSEAVTGIQALGMVRSEKWDLVITDLFMPGGGREALPDLVKAAGKTPVVLFTVSEAPDDIRAALSAGVRAFIPKTTDDPVILGILKLVLAGGTYAPPALACAMAPSETRDAETPIHMDGLPPLTRRQYQVLELLSEGMSNAEIGSRMGLNLSTVKSHVTGVLRALDVASRTQAVLTFKQADWSGRH
jgi:DNA-binding NarL/FixJ family response regulator